ncbi:MAG: c-type cytochrome domain-containing protein, partial [Pirellulales bacterium]
MNRKCRGRNTRKLHGCTTGLIGCFIAQCKQRRYFVCIFVLVAITAAYSVALAGPEVSSPSNHFGHGKQTVLQAVDASANSKWCGHHEGKPVQWQLELPEATAIAGYSLTSGGDVPSRDPDHWVLEGSVNGKNWTQLDQQENQPEWEKRRQSKHFPINNRGGWRYFRFTFQFDDPTHYQLSEIAFDGVSMEGVIIAAPPTIEELRSQGKTFSKYLGPKALAVPDGVPTANLTTFQHEIRPLLEASCVKCHGPDKQEGDFRIDALDPDMIDGDDGDWWVEVTDIISQGEMPPPEEEEVALADDERAKVVNWISQELLVASQSRRSEQGHTSFRRLTRYETSYALQDLLGLPYDFARDL